MEQNTRQKLIDATYEEVYSHGYQGAALADILSNAGVHKGSMYHFFPNKKEMALSAIKEKIAHRFGSIMELNKHWLKGIVQKISLALMRKRFVLPARWGLSSLILRQNANSNSR